jgi:hypothetical protein
MVVTRVLRTAACRLTGDILIIEALGDLDIAKTEPPEVNGAHIHPKAGRSRRLQTG